MSFHFVTDGQTDRIAIGSTALAWLLCTVLTKMMNKLVVVRQLQQQIEHMLRCLIVLDLFFLLISLISCTVNCYPPSDFVVSFSQQFFSRLIYFHQDNDVGDILTHQKLVFRIKWMYPKVQTLNWHGILLPSVLYDCLSLNWFK